MQMVCTLIRNVLSKQLSRAINALMECVGHCIDPNRALRSQDMKRLIQYFYEIKPDKAILWCYLIWYLVTVFFYFDPSPKIWINSVGISLVIGTGLLLSVSSGKSGKRDPWQTFRLYLMPFCVSSFSALIKDQGFIIIVSPKLYETAVAAGICFLFLGAIATLKRINPKRLF